MGVNDKYNQAFLCPVRMTSRTENLHGVQLALFPGSPAMQICIRFWSVGAWERGWCTVCTGGELSGLSLPDARGRKPGRETSLNPIGSEKQ